MQVCRLARIIRRADALFTHHGHYVRKRRHGAVKIVRYCCRTNHATFYLLLDYLVVRLSGMLSQLEAVVSALESEANLLHAACAVRVRAAGASSVARVANCIQCRRRWGFDRLRTTEIIRQQEIEGLHHRLCRWMAAASDTQRSCICSASSLKVWRTTQRERLMSSKESPGTC